jgi:hypothetical protein
MGEYLLTKCRIEFFNIFKGIVKQIVTTENEESIKFLLNCTKWRFGASDHEYILNSQLITVLRDGNNKLKREENPIKYSWGHKIEYRNYNSQNTLSHTVLESLEFLMMI